MWYTNAKIGVEHGENGLHYIVEGELQDDDHACYALICRLTGISPEDRLAAIKIVNAININE